MYNKNKNKNSRNRNGKKQDYSQLNLDDFSDDDSDDGGRHQSDFRDEYGENGDESGEFIRNQQVRRTKTRNESVSFMIVVVAVSFICRPLISEIRFSLLASVQSSLSEGTNDCGCELECNGSIHRFLGVAPIFVCLDRSPWLLDIIEYCVPCILFVPISCSQIANPPTTKSETISFLQRLQYHPKPHTLKPLAPPSMCTTQQSFQQSNSKSNQIQSNQSRTQHAQHAQHAQQHNNNNNTQQQQQQHTTHNNNTQQSNQVLMKMQDAGLDALSESVLRLGEMSNGISDELGQQNKMLDSMETDLDTAGEELDIVTRSTKQLIAKSGGMSTFCLIVTLSIVVLFLLFLIIYG